jgi:hypothetical protein
MKLFVLTILVLLSSSQSFSAELNGEEFLANWVGDYRVTKCISCIDDKLNKDLIITDISEFYIGNYIVSEDDLPRCATTKNDIYFGYVIRDDSGITWTSFFSKRTLCYDSYRRDVPQGININITRDEFVYTYNNPKNNSYRHTSIKRISDFKFEVTQKVKQHFNNGQQIREFEFRLEVVKELN